MKRRKSASVFDLSTLEGRTLNFQEVSEKNTISREINGGNRRKTKEEFSTINT